MPKKGFESYDKEALREMAARGGRAAHEAGVAHEWTKEEAREAGRRGGAATAAKRKTQRETP